MRDALTPLLAKQNTRYREAVDPEKRLFIGLYVLAHEPATCDVIGKVFGIGAATVSDIFEEFCDALIQKFKGRICFPFSGPALERVIDAFEGHKGLKNCAGAIDCTHINHLQPIRTEGVEDYHDRNKNYSTVLQAIVDHNSRFLNVCIGYPGSVHDARIFTDCDWLEQMSTGHIMQGPIKEVSGVLIAPYLIGDAAYPLSKFMIKPYPGINLSMRQAHFNYILSSTRMSVECAFGQVKSRFRILSGKMLFRLPRKIVKTIGSGCILHNICKDMDDPWADDAQAHPEVDEVMDDAGDANVQSGATVRNAVADSLFVNDD